MTLRFGTDGVRGPADELSDPFVRALGEAAASVLGTGSAFLIGRDTRESGPRIERALAAGMARAGVEPVGLGVVPTPTVAWVSAQRGVPGAVISASHNPWADNGIKFFAAGGRKLSDEVEERLEALVDELLATGVVTDVPASDVPLNDVRVDDEAIDGWCESILSAVEGAGDGAVTWPRIVIDCANGAASRVAPRIFEALGADVEVLHADPDGHNINDACGSTHPEDLQRRVVERGASLGLAFDGDADRLLAVDEQGGLVDGDHLLALFAVDLQSRGALAGDLVVVTVMTNLGFRLAMADQGIAVVETPVGDRHVLEALERTAGSLGGEQSGHIVFADRATTGDGILSGVQLLDLVVRSGRRLSELADRSMTRLPQVLRNVRVADRRADIADALAADVDVAEAELGDRGRVLIRPSGTEPLVRVMVEAPTAAQAEAVAERLAAAVERACSA
jgi:phosphoglucosamine mutase